MKKIILLVLIVFMASCNKQQETHRYEILLSTKDTIYIDASSYYITSKGIAVFKDVSMTIVNPIYIKEIK